MLTSIQIRNFKRFGEIEVELGNPVVLIGPNNSGKSSALQALALWEIGLKRWVEKRGGKKAPEKRPGVTINRRDLIAVPVPYANLLWRNLHVRDVGKINGKQETQNIRIEIIVSGITNGAAWKCGFEFDYANEESFYCRPLRMDGDGEVERMPIPDQAKDVTVAFLPPMSGLAANELRLDVGAINVRIGEGRTAEVLRNLCYSVHSRSNEEWRKLAGHIQSLFGIDLETPRYIAERGEIVMTYKERGTKLDLSSAGRGLQQTLLLLAYMYEHSGAVLLLDEPDAHLEILRQRQIYQLLSDVSQQNNNQIVAASHSEVLLNEASERDVVVAFVGAPHRINDRGNQVLKALKEIGFQDYYLAEQKGWILYLEGSTDLAILNALARTLNHKEAMAALERPFVKYIGNHPDQARRHFHGLREAAPTLTGIALFDRLERDLPADLGCKGLTWKRREIENYLCYPETLETYAKSGAIRDSAGPLFAEAEADRRLAAMQEAIQEVTAAMEKLKKGSPWSVDTKVSDEFLDPLFELYFKKLGLPNVMAKKNFHILAEHLPKKLLDTEVKEKLDALVEIAIHAKQFRDSEWLARLGQAASSWDGNVVYLT